MAAKSAGRIVIIMDERLSREKVALLNRSIDILRRIAEVRILPAGTSEDELLLKLNELSCQLIIVPWYRYLVWSRVEAVYGLTRTTGPTFAGYFCEPLLPYELGAHEDQLSLRTILLDFSGLTPHESLIIVRSLFQDSTRGGIYPLLTGESQVYTEAWNSGKGNGIRMDVISGLPEVIEHGWGVRANAIRICMTALWSLVYDGPGKSEMSQAISAVANTQARAQFNVSASAQGLVFRLCYGVPGGSPKSVFEEFWPNTTQQVSSAQLLIRYGDFLRVHWIPETSEIEVVVGFFRSGPSEAYFAHVHTLWIEPISNKLVFATPKNCLKDLPGMPIPLAQAQRDSEKVSEIKAKDRAIADASSKIKALHEALAEKDRQILELRAGGVGTAEPLPPPQMEDLVETFQERYFEARYQIRQFELEIADLEKKGATQGQIEALQKKMAALIHREHSWIKRISTALRSFRPA